MKKYQDHPLSEIFPLMDEKDLNELAKDIEEEGLLAPITLLDGKILDGRNRYRACEIAGVEPKFREHKGGFPLQFILSANLHRRHLTDSQRAMVAANLANLPRGKNNEGGANLPIPEIAKALAVSARLVKSAKSVQREGTKNQVKAVVSGEKTIHAVQKEIKEHKEQPSKPEVFHDKTGVEIPDCILVDWQRADAVKELMYKLSEVRCEVRKGLEAGDVVWRETSAILAHLNNAYGELKVVVPFAVCTCGGHNRKACAFCKGRGFLSEFRYEKCVASEVKKMREKKK